MLPARKVFLVALLFSLPLALLHLYLFLVYGEEGLIYTGYLQYDQPYYVTFAVQYFHDGFHLHAANVLGPDPSPARIYFFLPLWLVGGLISITGASPVVVQNVFGWLAAVGAFYHLIRIVERLFPLRKAIDWLTTLCFAWGGGLLVLAGLFRINLINAPMDQIFAFDPFNGIWMLNLGRSLLFPPEAFYHFLFILLLRFLLEGRHRAGLLCLVGLSLSSPFTGLQALCVAVGWLILEKLFFARKTVSYFDVAAAMALLLFHLANYLFILNQDELHRAVHDQFHVDWQLHALSMWPAYILPGGFVLWHIQRLGVGRLAFLQRRDVRLGLVLFGVSFGLANNEIFLSESIQPLHFTRGYLWTGLMIAGLPMLRRLFEILSNTRLLVRSLAIGSLVLVFLTDNIVWFSTFPWLNRQHSSYRESATADVLQWFRENPDQDALVLWPDVHESMILYTQTHMRSWFAHQYSTPFGEQRQQEMLSATNKADLTEQMRRHDLYFVLELPNARQFLAIYRLKYPEAPSPDIRYYSRETGIIFVPKSL